MTCLAERLARPEIVALGDFDIPPRAVPGDTIKLDANENPFEPLGPAALAASVNRYPEPQPARLKAMLASLYGVDPDALVVTRGADDAIDMLIRAFCRPGDDAILIAPPTFTAYAHFARLQGARVVEHYLGPDFALDAQGFVAAARATPSLKLAFLCSPDNPTGGIVAADTLCAIADALPETILVVDEAYIEFSCAESVAREAVRRPNLVVLRTLSKAFGLAGARIGAAIGSRALIALAARALPPYPLSSLSIAAALDALAPERRRLHADRIARIIAERARMAERLRRASGLDRVRDGGGNFLFLEAKDPAKLRESFAAAGILARFRETAAPGGVRLTIGTRAENDAVLAALGIGDSPVGSRRADIARDTNETRIAVAIDLDAAAPRRIDTGVPFFDHMLDQVAAHGGFSLLLTCTGDLHVDAHHCIEDCAIAFGSALSKALGDRSGIGRYGFSLPMDEARAEILLDLSGRPYSLFEGSFAATHIGAYPTMMTAHVFRSFADALRATVHVRVAGEDDHHKTEACFKALGRALRQAIRREAGGVPSTKGLL
ncbi:histidinol-phosphate transaminase [Allosphingosinicella indica]|uniref:Multifunctional fusion protein n=1 Tax=Allosphingosinicella indica TaxID=941907 RepID=A0A1X7FZU9_9SPHN|nr:histidinol-phosphate transaminase [Allosphingosinicella indica]SMF61085.1 imidazoleglycerol-phosphate dehydratase [Allosphingosinicella indica]